MNFGEYVRERAAAGSLVVQPRMGFSDPAAMRAGLIATRRAAATTVGTITLDSYTRLGELDAVDRSLSAGLELNGYPIVSHDPRTTRWVLDGVAGERFPVQVRHGSAQPQRIFESLIEARLHATEGGPVSYCLPYGRTPLDESVRNWTECCELLAQTRATGVEPHLETFGGCLMGQLCPPGLLVAVSVLEALFFHRHGLRSISVSYAQQTHPAQDREAIAALRRLCAELLPAVDWHVVVYAYMGLFPQTGQGARRLLGEAALLAVATGAERLIVKTVAESARIPTVAENVNALEHAGAVARSARAIAAADGGPDGGQTYQEAYTLVEAVLNCGPEIGPALVVAFKRGLLDVPYCLHPDNAGRTRSYLGADGRLRWADLGALPLSAVAEDRGRRVVTSADLMNALSWVRRRFDGDAPEPGRPHPLGGRGPTVLEDAVLEEAVLEGGDA